MSGGRHTAGFGALLAATTAPAQSFVFCFASFGGHAWLPGLGKLPRPTGSRNRGMLPRNQDSIRGNNGTGLPTTCPSGNLPHSVSAKTKGFLGYMLFVHLSKQTQLPKGFIDYIACISVL